MESKGIMLLGTASSVGKSTLATAICRYFTNKNLKVAPFKAMNISLNSFVTKDGLEMGRAQVVQAEACNIEPEAFMNPLLLKPNGGKTQVIVNGKVKFTMDAYKYKEINNELKKEVSNTYNSIKDNYDLLVLEGSGSCAEINLKDTDIANMAMAKMADVPAILVADIDRGGVFASVVGTLMLLEEEDRKRVKGVIINKFRGRVDLFKDAMKQLEDIIDVPVLGVMPHCTLDIEDEDGVSDKILNKSNKKGKIDIAVIKLPHMSNFTDFNNLERMNDLSVRYAKSVDELNDPHMIIIPGSKNTIDDLKIIKNIGLYDRIKDLHAKGTLIFGVCGGYQMLGEKIIDDHKIEGDTLEEIGLNLLDFKTKFNKEKTTIQTKAFINDKNPLNEYISNITLEGYEIHNGVNEYNEDVVPFICDKDSRIIGSINKEGTVIGTYLHGIFDSDEFNLRLIEYIAKRNNISIEGIEKNSSYREHKLKEYDKLADLLKENIDIKKLEEIIGI
ncbi:cobyric acid synthase [Clostridium sardiniense]|uniref:cobyric acid synthase n=1 Tax=Clostridium sardiniense TaxID=29369 RepID=UPI001959F41B|nr:cobyric acid synthase [Clostridium sardiniense]MBM7834195.1 adenosylcobyric acid synthase [Clostridium sardiniense]